MPHTHIQTPLAPKITPQELLPLIHTGQVTYVEFEEFIYFHFTFIKILTMLKAKGKPLVVHLRSVDNDIFPLSAVQELLLRFTAVDAVLDVRKKHFTLAHDEVGLFSNTYFFGKDINAHSEELIDRRRSFYHHSAKRVSIPFSKYLRLERMTQKIDEYVKDGKTVAIVTGIFDVVHTGHIQFLSKAKKQVDVLIVLINSDLSTTHQPKNRLHDRPVHRLHERIGVLDAIRETTHIVPFDTQTALPILEKLQKKVTYIKTVKDKERKSILAEATIVRSHGGRVVFLPNMRNKAGSVISSTMLIRACRKKAHRRTLTFDETWPPTLQKMQSELYYRILDWDKKTGRIRQVREELRSRYDGSIKTAVRMEQKAIEEVCNITIELIKTLPEKKSYYTYIIPYLLGIILDFPVRIIPVQLNKPKQPSVILNAVQRLGGRTVFFDSLRQHVIKPVLFEDRFEKLMPTHPHYQARRKKGLFAIRVFVFPHLLHITAVSLRVLLEEYEDSGQKDRRIKTNIISLSRMLWGLLEDKPFDERILKLSTQRLPKEHPGVLPGIIAHGGASVLSPTSPRAENSRRGIEYSLQANVDFIELDIVPCKDGWIVSHDLHMEIGTEKKGLTTDYTEQELRNVRLRIPGKGLSKEKMMTLTDVLELIGTVRKGDERSIYVKIDIKHGDPILEKRLVDMIKESSVPIDKILITSTLIPTCRNIHEICPELPFEFNGAESNLVLFTYQLMGTDIMIDQYKEYIAFYASLLNTRIISLAYFATSFWGNDVTRKVITMMHSLGFQVQLWFVTSVEDYKNAGSLGADYVQMQNPTVIHKALVLKNSEK